MICFYFVALDFKEELTKVPKLLEADDMIEEVHSDDGDQPKLSKRKLKKMSRLSVAQLKQLVVRPGKNPLSSQGC